MTTKCRCGVWTDYGLSCSRCKQSYFTSNRDVYFKEIVEDIEIEKLEETLQPKEEVE